MGKAEQGKQEKETFLEIEAKRLGIQIDKLGKDTYVVHADDDSWPEFLRLAEHCRAYYGSKLAIEEPMPTDFGTFHVKMHAGGTPPLALNASRFDNWHDAYLAWVRETQDFDDWGELDGDSYDQAEELWTRWFADDQNREFLDWAFKPAKEN